MMNLIRRQLATVLTLVAALAALGTVPSPASAQDGPGIQYQLHNCKMPSTTVRWSDQTGGGAYGQQAIEAAASWDSATPLTMQLVGASPIHIIADQSYWGKTDWAGLTQGAGGGIPSCTSVMGVWQNLPLKIMLNTYFTDDYPANKKQSVFAHEMGHALGIFHQSHPGTTCGGLGLMYYTVAFRYDVCGQFLPQTDDVAAIHYIY
ncbi:matrixin family metalloprotease [Micromonospora sp. NPDC050417]|uniref:matrixin family metalloprotease n=1 Tax=Micromonospora sp. NPDC050417 TaxID=3364280 RepID=UPI00379D2099